MNSIINKSNIKFYNLLGDILLKKLKKYKNSCNYLKNKKSMDAANLKYRENNQEKYKKFKKENSDRYREQNREKYNTFYKNLYHTKKLNDEWIANRREKNKLNNRKYRAKAKELLLLKNNIVVDAVNAVDVVMTI